MKFTDTNESVTADLENGFCPPLAQQGSTPRPNMPELADQISDLFSKAAEIIGYAMNLDGLSFFDATTSGSHYKSDHLPSLSVDDEPLQRVAHEGDLLAKPLSEYREDDEAAPRLICRPRQSLIKRLTTEYPQGHVFAIDEFGVLDYESDHAADLNSSPKGHAEKKWEDLFECVPKARYVIFLPLWHYQRESCFATCLAWVSNTGKTLDHGDVNSLTAFGNSLMAEIMRIEALTNTQSKSDFISSISHELRSPLHGILATVDLMQENVTDPDLLSMVDMIESCSTTLLDTFDHLLNFTKINSRANDVGRARESVGHVERVPVDLGGLVEDVLETVTLGHSSAMQMQFGLDREQHAAMTDSAKEKTSESVIVTTYIESDRNWVMPLEKGAWKRILLNLCSNALKYTKTGYIDVSLRLLEDTEGGLPHISLSVTDTGIGMSPAFLKHHLFTPFMQENHLTPGTGLGLSLVKSIVESINGKIFVVSRLHEGTRVTVNVPLGNERGSLDRLDINNITSNSENSLRGLSLSLLSIASDGSNTKSTPHIISTPRELSRSIRNICEKKFGMTVIEISTNAQPKTDVVLVDTHALASPNMLDLDKLFTEKSLQTTNSTLITLGVPVKGLSNLFGGAEAIRMSSPITRKRLGIALLAALERMKTDVDTQAEQASPRSLPIRLASTITKTTSPTFLTNDTAIQDPSSTRPDSPKRPTPMYRSPSIDIIPPIPCRFKRFLLVDDNSINLRVLSAFATRIGVPYSLAYNGAEAVHLYQTAALDGKDPFDCVFMDISMPVMDGFRAVTAIRRFEEEQQQSGEADGGNVRLHQAYILALTGLASGGARVLAKTSGFDGFLVKPVRFRDVLPLLAVQSKSATTNPSP
jgi:signal transduction histidine kinase/CheY-like chemotaxis protein